MQDAFRCRLRNCQDPISGDATGTFPNGHAQIMVGTVTLLSAVTRESDIVPNVPLLHIKHIHHSFCSLPTLNKHIICFLYFYCLILVHIFSFQQLDM